LKAFRLIFMIELVAVSKQVWALEVKNT